MESKAEARLRDLGNGELDRRRVLLLDDSDSELAGPLKDRGATVTTARPTANARWSAGIVGEAFDIAILAARPTVFGFAASVLDELRYHLAPSGFVALEVDIAPSRDNGMMLAGPAGRQTPHPTYRLVTEGWLRGYAFRRGGTTAKRSDCDLQRHRLHAFPKLPQVLLVTGQSHSGKTSLLRQLHATGAVEVRIDQIVNRLLRMDDPPPGRLYELAAEFERIGNRSVSQLVDTAIDEGLAPELAGLIHDHVPLEHPFIVIEGYGLDGDVRQNLLERFGGRAVAWSVRRPPENDAAHQLGNASADPPLEVVKARHAQEKARLLERIEHLEQAMNGSAHVPRPGQWLGLRRWIKKRLSSAA